MDPMCADLQLTRTQRIYGFGGCFAVGFLISCLSTLFFAFGNFTGFALLYTFGNIVSLMGTGFLVGFLTQFKKMFDTTRITASIVFLSSMALTLVFALTNIIPTTALRVLIVLICCAVQFLALFWYSISYIPFARDMFKGCLGGCI